MWTSLILDIAAASAGATDRDYTVAEFGQVLKEYVCGRGQDSSPVKDELGADLG
jgi:hypothetical protein